MGLQFIVFLSVFVVNNGFLLDGNSPKNNTVSGAQSQFLTIDDKLKLERDLLELNAVQAKSLNILAQKLDKLNKKVESVLNENGTCANNKNIESKLQQLELENAALKTANKGLETSVQNLQFDLVAYKNRTTELETEMRDLKLLKTIETKIQSIDVKVKTLTSNDLARNDDFLALYSLTMHSLKAIDIRDQELNGSFHALSQHLSTLENTVSSAVNQIDIRDQKLNDSFYALSLHLSKLGNTLFSNEKGVDILDQKLNVTIHSLSQSLGTLQDAFEHLNRINQDKNLVSVSARAHRKTYNASEIVQFTRTPQHFSYFHGHGHSSHDHHHSSGGDGSYGYLHSTSSNQADFTSSGKFNCTTPGLYLVSFTLMSNADSAYFNVFKNKELLNRLFIGSLTSAYREVTGVFVLKLQAGDTVYVKCGKQQYVYENSMITIVKIN